MKSVEALPGVRSASVTRGLPIESWSGQFFVNQDQPNPPAGHVPDANYIVVGPRYFETMQIPLRAGRRFGDHDTAGGLPVVIVNEELARTQWPGQNAIGRRIKMGGPSDTNWPWLTVVGVAGSAMTEGPQSGVRAEVYVPYQQYPWLLVPQHLVVRASPGTAPAGLTRSIVAEISGSIATAGDGHPDAGRSGGAADGPAADGDGAARRLRRRRACARGAGDLQRPSYSVGQRRREFGVRVALGAQQADVVRLVVGSGARLAMVGLGVGLVAALLLTRLMIDLLYGVPPADP